MTINFVRSFQGIDEYLLPNGLKVLLFRDDAQANVTVNLTYLVGSRHEGRGEAGMAHLLEHMLFRGTKKTRDIKAALQNRGAQYNATTWFDRTNYFETLAPSRENLEFALELEADRMINSLILQEDLDSEMTVVRNEFEMGENNPVHVLHDQMMSSAYRWHNYGKTTIGNRSDIERVPVIALRKFYEHYYQPDNAVLIIAGQFVEDDALALIDAHFSSIKRPTRELSETYTEEPAQDGPRAVTLERVGDMASVAVAYHIPAACHADHASLKILFDFLADEPGGLIYQKLVETGKCSEVFSMTYALFEPGMALCFVRPTEDDEAFSISEELIDLLENKALASLLEEHVERMKIRALKRIKLAMANSKELSLKLSEAIACGDFRLFFWYREQIQKVSLDDVKRVLRTYVISSNRTAGIFVPRTEPVRIAIEKAPPAEVVVENAQEDTSLAGGEAFIATSENIEKLTERRSFGPEKLVAILNKKTRGQMVRMQLRFRFGTERTILPNVKDFWLVPSMLWRGTSKLSYQQLRDRIDSLMSTLELDGHGSIMAATIKSERGHLNDMLDLLRHMLSEPAFSADEFALVRQREIDNYEEVKSDPQRLGFQELERLRSPYPKGDIHYVYSFDEIIDGLKTMSLAHLTEAYNRLFSWDHTAASVVGDCDRDSLLTALSKFAPMNTPPYERITRPYIDNLVQEVELDTKDKEMAIIAYAFNFPMRDDHPDFVAIKLANYMFGENMNSRLMNRIREREGISYGAGSSIEISRHEECASVSIYAMAAPASVARGRVAINEEWEKFINYGVSEEELRAAQESMWQRYINLLANDGYLMSALAHDLEVGRDFFFREQRMERMRNLSVSDIKNALQKWWGGAKFSKVVAADFSKMS